MMKHNPVTTIDDLVSDSARTLIMILHDELVRGYFFEHCRRCEDADIEPDEWLDLFSDPTREDDRPTAYRWEARNE